MKSVVMRVLTLGMTFALAACAGTRAAPGTSAQPLAGTSLRLAEVNGAPALAIAGEAPTLVFAASEPRTSGNLVHGLRGEQRERRAQLPHQLDRLRRDVIQAAAGCRLHEGTPRPIRDHPHTAAGIPADPMAGRHCRGDA